MDLNGGFLYIHLSEDDPGYEKAGQALKGFQNRILSWREQNHLRFVFKDICFIWRWIPLVRVGIQGT